MNKDSGADIIVSLFSLRTPSLKTLEKKKCSHLPSRKVKENHEWNSTYFFLVAVMKMIFLSTKEMSSFP